MTHGFLGTIGWIKGNLMTSSQASEKGYSNENFYPGAPNIPESESKYPKGVPPTTRGLVFCFDAQNNTGNGWNAQATDWTDLITLKKASMYLSSDKFIENEFGKGANFPSRASNGVVGYGGVSMNGNFTYEVFYTPTDYFSNSTSLGSLPYNSKSVGLQVGTINAFYKNSSGGLKAPSRSTDCVENTFNYRTIVGSITGNVLTLTTYYNGNYDDSDTYTYSSEEDALINVSGTLKLGNDFYRNAAGLLHGFRLYNTPLTAEEIFSNYQYTKTRYTV